MRVYLDSCVIIYLTEGGADMQDRIGRRLLLPEDDPPTVVFTDLSRLECRVKPLVRADTATLTDYDEFFATPGYLKISIDTATFDLATVLRARHGLMTPDALHLAAAITSGCDEFWSNDERLVRASDTRVRMLTVEQLA